MKFLSIYKHVERNTPPSQEEMVRMGKLVEEGHEGGMVAGNRGLPAQCFGGARSAGRHQTQRN